MKTKIKQRIADLIVQNGYLKLTIRNLDVLGELTEQRRNELLDEIAENNKLIEKLKEVLKEI